MEIMLMSKAGYSQSVGIGASQFTPSASSRLEVQSTTKGVLIPRLTDAQRKALKTPLATGLIIYNTTTNRVNLYNGSASNGGPGWMEVPSDSVSSPVNPGSAAVTGVTVSATLHAPDQSAMLDVFSTTQGVLIPRIIDPPSTHVPAPATGCIVFNSTTDNINWYDGTTWQALCLDFIDNTTGGAGSTSGGIAISSAQTSPAASALLDVSSSSQGIRIPILTAAQRDAILTPAQGLLVYVDGTAPEKRIESWDGTKWKQLVNYAPVAVGTIAGSSSACAGQTGAVYEVPSVQGAAYYTWTYGGAGATGFTCTSGCATNAISANYSAGATNGTITVTAVNGCGTSSATLPITIAGPTAPTTGTPSATSVITHYGSCPSASTTNPNITLTVSGGSGYVVVWHTGSCAGPIAGTGNPLSIPNPGVITTYYGQWVDGCGNKSSCVTVSAPVNDGTHIYAVTNIGTQTWLAQGLNCGVQELASGTQTAFKKWCVMDSANICDSHTFHYAASFYKHSYFPKGGVYSYDNVMTNNLCGLLGGTWHLPTDAEWCTLENYDAPGTDPLCNLTGWRYNGLGSDNLSADLKEECPWQNGGGSCNWGCSSTGLLLFNSGFYFNGNWSWGGGTNFGEETNNAFFWTATVDPITPANAFYRYIQDGNPVPVSRGSYPRNYGMGVRCVK